MFFKKFNTKVAIITPFKDTNNSPLYYKGMYKPGIKWLYYHNILSKNTNLQYFRIEEYERIKNYDYVFIHESFYDIFGDRTVTMLNDIKMQNKILYWIELHEKSFFSEAVFLDGFFETIDRIYKHQLLEFDFLKDNLKEEYGNLVPFYNYNEKNMLEYYQNKRFFSFNISDNITHKHINFDFQKYEDQILPLMYPFSYEFLNKSKLVYTKSKKKYFIGHAGRRLAPSHVQRNYIFNYLQRSVDDNKLHYDEKNYLDTLKHSKFFMGLGHIHSSLRTFDCLAFNTVLVHYEKFPYKMWDEFEEYKTFLPFGNPHKIFKDGWFGADENNFEKTIDQFIEDINNEELLINILENQKELFSKIIDDQFIMKKLGIEIKK